MSNKLKLSLLALSIMIGISAAIVYVAARRQTQRQSAAMTLIRDMDGIDQQLSQASREFGIALRQFLESAQAADASAEGLEAGETSDGAAEIVRQSHRTLVDSVNRSIGVVSRLEAPESEHGAAFISAQRKFLLVQRGIIREDFGKLLGLLGDASVPPTQRVASIGEIVDAAFTETEKEFAVVHAAREKFAAEFAIHLTVR